VTWLIVVVVVVVVAVAVPLVLVADVLRRARLGVLDTCPVEEVPSSFGGAVAEFVQQHYVVAGAIRISNPKAPDAYVVLFANPAVGAYGRLWVTGESRAQAVVSTPLEPGTLITATHLPTTVVPGELQQMFPDATNVELCARHAEALEFLAARGVERAAVEVDRAEATFRESWHRDLEATRGVRPKLFVEAATRMVFSRPRFVGPLASQAGIDERILRRSGA
jgi:hypothetical protein